MPAKKLTISDTLLFPLYINKFKQYLKQVQIYYGSGTAGHCSTCAKQTLRVHSPDGGTCLHEMMSRPPSWNCQVKSKTRLCRSMHTYLRNNCAKFHSDPIWNDRALGFFWRGPPTTTTTTRWLATWDQFLLAKSSVRTLLCFYTFPVLRHFTYHVCRPTSYIKYAKEHQQQNSFSTLFCYEIWVIQAFQAFLDGPRCNRSSGNDQPA